MAYDCVPFSPHLLDTHLVVDVRTPLEFAEDRLPGAINVPLLSDDERVEIGTMHKTDGPHAARIRGLELTAARFPSIVAGIAKAAAGRPVLVYCWRGGLRSRTVASILDLTGFRAVQLLGGYKSFRAHVIRYFDPFTPPGPLVVMHGMTGIGKTTFILGLRDAGHSIVDLEGLACHRGSAFGELGLSQNLSQKRFETTLWDAFRRIPPTTTIIVEGESKRIGRISLPGDLYEKMQESVKVWCQASLETRVARLTEEYGIPDYREGMEQALARIRKRLGSDRHVEIAGYLERWEMEPFMRELVRNYYDKVYYKTRNWEPDATLSLEDFTAAAQELSLFLRDRIE